MTEQVSLAEFDRDEWELVARQMRPDWTEEDFVEAWDEFVEMKQGKRLN